MNPFPISRRVMPSPIPPIVTRAETSKLKKQPSFDSLTYYQLFLAFNTISLIMTIATSSLENAYRQSIQSLAINVLLSMISVAFHCPTIPSRESPRKGSFSGFGIFHEASKSPTSSPPIEKSQWPQFLG